MTQPPEGGTPQPSMASRGLWAVRGAALATVVLISGALLWHRGSVPLRLLLIAEFGFCWPYLLVLVLLHGRPRKSGLALAVGTGAVGCVLAVPALLSVGNWERLGIGGLVFLTQAWLAVSAIRTYYTLERGARDKFLLAGGFAIPVLYLVLIAVPNAMNLGRRSPSSRAATDTKQIVIQTQLYIGDNHALPDPARMPQLLWDKAAPGNTVYMAATYDPFPSPTANYGYAQAAGAGLTGEIVSWSVGPTGNGWMAPDGKGCRDGAIGYSSKLGACGR